MNLPRPPAQYDVQDQTALRDALRQADQKTHKKGLDIEVGEGVRILLTDTSTQARWALTVTGGALRLSPA